MQSRLRRGNSLWKLRARDLGNRGPGRWKNSLLGNKGSRRARFRLKVKGGGREGVSKGC